MNEHYRVVLEDAEKKLEQIELECLQLSERLKIKQTEKLDAEKTIGFILDKLLPFSESENESTVAEIETEESKERLYAVQKLDEYIDTAQRQNFNEANESNIAFGNATELLLLAEGRSLHADVLLERIAMLGRFPDKANYTSTIRKDSKGRFVNLGENVWDLRRRHE
jgi:hypothetical protein